ESVRVVGGAQCETDAIPRAHTVDQSRTLDREFGPSCGKEPGDPAMLDGDGASSGVDGVDPALAVEAWTGHRQRSEAETQGHDETDGPRQARARATPAIHCRGPPRTLRIEIG